MPNNTCGYMLSFMRNFGIRTDDQLSGYRHSTKCAIFDVYDTYLACSEIGVIRIVSDRVFRRLIGQRLEDEARNRELNRQLDR